MERENIRSLQAEEIAVAKANGVSFGRPPKERLPELDAYIVKYLRREMSSREAAKAVGIPQGTFLNRVRE
jgi:DNA invertase Pin-like site-specific DNA recombinase